MLYEILEQSAEFYEYEIYSLNEETMETLQYLNEVYLDGENTLPPNILFKELNQWLLKLPRFTQITNKQPDEILKFKQIIRSSETDPLIASKEFLNLGFI